MKRTKRIFAFLLILAMLFALTACGNTAEESQEDVEVESEPTEEDLVEETEEVESANENDLELLDEEAEDELVDEEGYEEEVVEEIVYSLGEMVSTDVMEFTLDLAEPTIALENSHDDEYYFYAPKEYDATGDKNNPYVASIGHALIYFSLIVTNLDRNSVYFGGSVTGLDDFAYVIYDGHPYLSSVNIGAKSSNNIDWEKNESLGVSISPSETLYLRCYMDIPVDIDNMSSNFDVCITLSDSSGGEENFIYRVTGEDIDRQNEREVSLDTAIIRFRKAEGKEYFQNHSDDFDAVSGQEFEEFIKGKKRYISEEGNDQWTYGGWEGYFTFEDSGKISEMKKGSENGKSVLMNYGYLANRTWEVNGDSVILALTTEKSGHLEYKCEVRLVEKGTYLLVCENEPFVLISTRHLDIGI